MSKNLYRRSNLNNEYSTKQFNVVKKQIILATLQLAYRVISVIQSNKLVSRYNFTRVFSDAFFIFVFQRHNTKLNNIIHWLFKVLYRLCFLLLNTTIIRYREHFTKVLNFIEENNKKGEGKNKRNTGVQRYDKKNVIKLLGNGKITATANNKIFSAKSSIPNAEKIKKLPHVFWHLIFKNVFVNIFVNSLIHKGKKEKVELLLFTLLCTLKDKTKKQPIFFISSVFQMLQPVVDTFNISRSGKPYPVPKVVKNSRRLSFLVRIMKAIVDKHKKKVCFNLRFVSEFVIASTQNGPLYSKILEMHRFSFDNRINMRFIRKFRRKRRVFV